MADSPAQDITRRQGWALRAYAEAAQALARSDSPSQVAKAVCDAIVEQYPYILAFVGFARAEDGKPIEIAYGAGEAAGYLDGLKLSWDANSPDGQGPTGTAMRAGTPFLMRDAETDPVFSRWRAKASIFGIRSSVTVPFRRIEDMSGVLVVYAAQPNAFGPDELELFVRLSDQVGVSLRSLYNILRLNQERDRLERLIQFAYSPILAVDASGRLTLFNGAAERIFGYAASEVLDQRLDVLLPDGIAESHQGQVHAFLMSESHGRQMAPKREVFGRRKDGETFPIEVALTRVQTEDGIIATAIINDLSERRDFEKRIAASAKMEALAHLAGGIAHDFNNILSVMRTNIEICLEALPPDLSERSLLQRVLRSADRGADLVRRLMKFARSKDSVDQRIDLDIVMEDLILILRRTVRDAAFELTFSDQGNCIQADPTLLETAVLNLAFNARDAGASKVSFTIGRTDWPSAQEGSPRHCVEIRVRDNGSGMPPQVRQRIFEPFFTTKEVGKGTGLGLSTVMNFVLKSDGEIEVESDIGAGTTFVLRFPEVTPA